MHNQFKAVVAAAALALAGAAHANIDNSLASAGSELVFGFVTGDSSYLKDLSVSFDNFDVNTNHTFALDNFGFSTAQLAAGKFEVIAVNQNSYSFLSTVADPANLADVPDYTKVLDLAGGFDGSVGFFNGPEGVPVTSSTPASTLHINKVLGFRWANNSPFNAGIAGNGIGEVYLGTTNLDDGVTTTALVGTFQITGNNLVYTAAVPEPETYALFGAGLLALGAIARRRARR